MWGGAGRALWPLPPPSARGPFPSPSHSLILDESVFVDGFDDIFEEDLGGQSVAVVHDGLPVGPVPAVHCGQADLGQADPRRGDLGRADPRCGDLGWADPPRRDLGSGRPTTWGPPAQLPTPAGACPSPRGGGGQSCHSEPAPVSPRADAGPQPRPAARAPRTYPPRSGSRPAGPRRTCPPETGTGAGRPRGRCCGTR